jgi:hypothetical protein
MKARDLYDEAVTKAAICVIAMSDPNKGIEDLQDSLVEFTEAVKAKVTETLLEALRGTKGMSIEELREMAGKKDH